MKNFVNGTKKCGNSFEYLREKFPKLSDAKLKEGIFIGLKFIKSFMMTYWNTCWLKLKYLRGYCSKWFV